MAGSGSYQVNVGGFRDPSLGAQRGLSALSDSILNFGTRADEQAVESAAAGKQLDISSVLNNLNTGEAVRSSVNQAYEDLGTNYTKAMALNSANIAEEQSIEAGMGYTADGKPIRSPKLAFLEQNSIDITKARDTKLAQMNQELVTRYNTNPGLLDAVTDPSAVKRQVFEGIVSKTGDVALAKQYADTYASQYEGEGIDYKLAGYLENAIKRETDSANELTTKTTTGDNRNVVQNADGTYSKISTKKSGTGSKFNKGRSLAQQVLENTKIAGIKAAQEGGYEFYDKANTDNQASIQEKIDNFATKNKADNLTEEEIHNVMLKSITGTGIKGGNLQVNADKMQEYWDTVGKKNRGQIGGSGKVTGGTKTEQTTKGKQYSSQSKANIASLTNQLNKVLSKGGGQSVSDVLGKGFTDRANTRFDSKIGGYTPKKSKVATPAKKPVTETFKKVPAEGMKAKPKIKNVLTKDSPQVKKTTIGETLAKDNAKTLTEVAKNIPATKPKVKTPTEIKKLTPKQKEVYDTSITVDNVLRGAGIRWDQAKADPVGTAKDLGLGVLNSFPALVSAIGDLAGVETGVSDSVSKALKGMRADKDSLGFDLAEATGMPAKSGLKVLQKAAKGTILNKAIKAPSLGTALGTTAKGIKKLSPANIAKKVKEYTGLKVAKLTKARRQKAIKDIRALIRGDGTTMPTTRELVRLQRKIKALQNAK